MNKKEAATYLNMSVRTLERHVLRGDVSVAYTRGARGRERNFDEEELKRFKETLETTTYVTRPAVAPVTASALVQTSETGKPRSLQTSSQQSASFGERLTTVLEDFQASRVVPLADKLTLSVDEAARLSGLSAKRLREAIKEGKLIAPKIGRGFRISPDSLRIHVKNLLKGK